MRSHAADPSWRIDVIRREASEGEMHWSRWTEWEAGDPRWRVHVLDSSALSVEQIASGLVEWIGEERALLRAGNHPLPGAALATS